VSDEHLVVRLHERRKRNLLTNDGDGNGVSLTALKCPKPHGVVILHSSLGCHRIAKMIESTTVMRQHLRRGVVAALLVARNMVPRPRPTPQLHAHVRLAHLCVRGCLAASSRTWTHSGSR
jgi:hypothetical protein